MHNRTPWTLLILPGLILAAGCSNPRFLYEVDPTFRTHSYESVAPDPRKDRIVIREGMRPLNPALHLRAALNELAARHYRTEAAPQADLWASVFVLTRAMEDGGQGGISKPHREGSGEGRRGGGRGGAANGGISPAGSGRGSHGGLLVIVQLEDRMTGLPVWQGEASLGPKDLGPDGDPLSIEEAVHQLMQAFPVRP